MKSMLKQRGVSLGGLVMVLILFMALAMFAMKLIPAYMENGKIQKAFDAIVRDPAMQNATPTDIRDSYYKRANVMDAVTTVNQGDIEINKEDGRLQLSASYNTKIPLAGNVSLLIEFNPKAPK